MTRLLQLALAIVGMVALPLQAHATSRDVRGSWLANIAGGPQSFTITQQIGTVIKGFGHAGCCTWVVTGSVVEGRIQMKWEYNEYDYSADLRARVDAQGDTMFNGRWIDTNGVQGTWTAGRVGTEDKLLIGGRVRGGSFREVILTLYKFDTSGNRTMVQQMPTGPRGHYEFFIDQVGTYAVEANLDYCVTGERRCKHLSDRVRFVDTGRGDTQEKTVQFIHKDDF